MNEHNDQVPPELPEPTPDLPAIVPPTPQLYLPISIHGPTRYCSLPCTSNEDKAQILRLAQGTDKRAEDMIGIPFPTRDLVIYPDQIEAKETGELLPVERTVWIGSDGQSMSIASDWTPSAMDKVRTLYGEPPWEPPLHLVIRTRKTRNSRTMYWVDVVFPQEAKPAPKKGR